MRSGRPCLLGLLLVAGCRATPSVPPGPPPLTLSVTPTLGAPLATTRPASPGRVTPAQLVGIEVTWVVATRPPEEDLLPLDAQSSLTSAPFAAGPVLTEGRQTRTARFGAGDAATRLLDRLIDRADGPVLQVGRQTAWVAPGTTVRFAAVADAPSRSASLAVYRPAFTNDAAIDPADAGSPPATLPTTTATRPGLATIVVTLEGTAAAEADAAGPADATADGRNDGDASRRNDNGVRPNAKNASRNARGTAKTAGRPDAAPAATAPAAGPESAYLRDLPLMPGVPYALVLPWRDAAGPWTTLIAYVEPIGPGPGYVVSTRPGVYAEPDAASDAARAADAWNALIASPAAIAAATTRPDENLTLRRALGALRQARDPRPALSYVATVTNARLTGDVVLVADATLLGKLRDAVLAADAETANAPAANAATPDALPAGSGAEALGWLLDRTALLTLADAGAKAPLPPEMVAVLAVYAGEAGRHADTLATVVNSVGSAADLRTRLVAENYIALEDNAPAARVRAFDWLTAQGRAPAGYDPLAPARQRRAAISRALSAPGANP